MSSKIVTLVAFGDSITISIQVAEERKRWPGLLQKRFRETFPELEFHVINGDGCWRYVSDLVFDQHALKALVAPRSLVSTEALGDMWANPTGACQTYRAAREVYRFLGAAERIGIWFRDGEHSPCASRLEGVPGLRGPAVYG